MRKVIWIFSRFPAIGGYHFHASAVRVCTKNLPHVLRKGTLKLLSCWPDGGTKTIRRRRAILIRKECIIAKLSAFTAFCSGYHCDFCTKVIQMLLMLDFVHWSQPATKINTYANNGVYISHDTLKPVSGALPGSRDDRHNCQASN